MKAISRRRFVISGLIVGVLLTAAGVAFFLLHSQPRDLNDVDDIKEMVSHHMVLPTDETPALVTVTDPSKLTTDFLKNTEVGDKILIYQDHQRAIIYRPSIDRIIDVGPVVIDDVTN